MRSPSSENILSMDNSENPWLVLKFGGTSIGKFLSKLTKEVIYQANINHRVAVVCSARSTDAKSKGTTSRLLQASDSVLSQENNYTDIVADILSDHIEAATGFINDPLRLETLVDKFKKECANLENFLKALSVIKEISIKSKDIIVGFGEKISCLLVAACLCDIGIDAEIVDLSNIITANLPQTKRLEQPFYDYLSKQFTTAVNNCKAKVPVVTGFFGPVPGGLLNSIGRGYTDLAAALVAVGIKAKELQIWKEVDGIFTADPRKVATARLLPNISPEEAAELTYYGSEVIHPFTMEQVMKAFIPIRIKNVQNPSGEGSLILPNDSSDNEMDDIVEIKQRHPTAVTIKDDIAILNVYSNRKSVSHDFLANLFSILDKHDVVVDLISTSEVHISMAINNGIDLTEVLEDLKIFGEVQHRVGMCILSLVGRQMRNMVGVAAQMFSTLAESKINIEMISQGSSEINISCVIAQTHGLTALNAIHRDLLEW